MKTGIQLNSTILKDIREKKKMSQDALASNAFSEGGSSSNKPLSRLRMYQEIEKTGRTSPDRAERIAAALDVTVQTLQGAEPREATIKLGQLIKDQFRKLNASGDSAGLDAMSGYFGTSLDENTEDFLFEDLAKNLIKDAAMYHFLGEIEELQSIAKIVSVSSDDLLIPMWADSYWWITAQNPTKYCSLGSLDIGHTSVTNTIFDTWDYKLLHHYRCLDESEYTDKVITASLKYADNQYRLTLHSTRIPAKCFFDFRACIASRETGIQWSRANYWEHYFLMNELKSKMFDRADVVLINDQRFPPENQRIVYRVVFHQLPIGTGNDDYPRLQQVGTKYFMDKNSLKASLQAILQKYLETQWRFIGDYRNGIDISLSQQILIRNRDAMEVTDKFYIYQGWIDDTGKFHEAPWPKLRREQFVSTIQNLVTAPLIDYDNEIPIFEPDVMSREMNEGVA